MRDSPGLSVPFAAEETADYAPLSTANPFFVADLLDRISDYCGQVETAIP